MQHVTRDLVRSSGAYGQIIIVGNRRVGPMTPNPVQRFPSNRNGLPMISRILTIPQLRYDVAVT